MSELRFTTMTLPAANLGLDSPLPPLPGSGFRFDPSPPPVRGDHPQLEYLGWAGDAGALPYGMQDGYDRQRQPRAVQVAVLENEFLRATFALEFGGRLWSLIHRPSGEELLAANPVFQPANLAIRNAWIAGGVEWNIGIIGHTPFTCSPLFAARLTGADGTPILRLYEWERLRQTPYQMDFFLPDGSPCLLARIGMWNPHDYLIPMYWWSNIAIRETADVRVLVPTAEVFIHDLNEFKLQPMPAPQGFDVTWPQQIAKGCDYFFNLPAGQRPWVVGLRQGAGLVQTSTARLRGRKLFVWGQRRGSQRWQEFLAEPGFSYAEIQAGLGQTQAQYVPMPAHAAWSWLEAYGRLETDSALTNGTDWNAAWRHVDARLEQLLPRATMETIFRDTGAAFDRPPEDVVQCGSGWAALEAQRRRHTGERAALPASLVFPEYSLGAAQEPWLELLTRGAFPERDAGLSPGPWLVQPEWRELLAQAVTSGRADHWLGWLHLGIMEVHRGQAEAAQAAWQTSLARCRNGWALRNLATYTTDVAQRAEMLAEARELLPEVPQLAGECLQALLAAERPHDALTLVGRLSPRVLEFSRIQIIRARVALAAGELEMAAQLLDTIMPADIREGEVALTDLWFGLHEQRLMRTEGCKLDEALRERVRREFPPPKALDFRAFKLDATPVTKAK